MVLTTAARSPSDPALVTIGTFPNPHEAELARAALESQGILAVVQNDHGQYLSAASWVQLQVAPGDGERAMALLERGPLDPFPETHEADSAEEPDELSSLRVKRRILLARWFLFVGAVSFLFSGFLLPLSAIAFALVLWSRWEPRRAFAVACALQTIVVFVAIALGGPGGLTALIPFFAFYFAWASTAPVPPPVLVSSPYPQLREVEIGNAWQTGEVDSAATAWPPWFLRDLGWFLLALAIVGGLVAALRAS